MCRQIMIYPTLPQTTGGRGFEDKLLDVIQMRRSQRVWFRIVYCYPLAIKIQQSYAMNKTLPLTEGRIGHSSLLLVESSFWLVNKNHTDGKKKKTSSTTQCGSSQLQPFLINIVEKKNKEQKKYCSKMAKKQELSRSKFVLDLIRHLKQTRPVS